MSRLATAIESVPADPSPASEEIQEPTPDMDPSLLASEGNQDDNEDPQEPGKERTADNVRGELLRKMQKSQDEVLQQLEAVRTAMAEAQKQYGVPNQQPATQPRTLDDMSIPDLEVMQATVPDEQKTAFNDYLRERKIDAKVEERLSKYQNDTQRKTAEQRFNASAIDRWPQLRDRNSEFYRKADQILSEMGTLAADNPRAVLDAANEAGLELGMQPGRGTVISASRREPGRLASGRKSGSPRSADSQIDTADQRQIAANLQNAMPGRKFTKEQLERISKRTKLYEETLSTRVRG